MSRQPSYVSPAAIGLIVRFGRMLYRDRRHRQILGPAVLGAAARMGALGRAGGSDCRALRAEAMSGSAAHPSSQASCCSRRGSDVLVAVLFCRAQDPATGRRDRAQLLDAGPGHRDGRLVLARADYMDSLGVCCGQLRRDVANPATGKRDAASSVVLCVGRGRPQRDVPDPHEQLAGDDLIALIFYPSLVGAVPMSLAVPFFRSEFSYLTSLDALLFIAIGIFGLLGHFLYIQAFQRATASTIAPCTYMQLDGQRSPGGWRLEPSRTAGRWPA